MRVLMFGWEFPPHITGGLGTACHGLSHAMVPHVSKLTFVLPTLKGEVKTDRFEIVKANEVPISRKTISEFSQSEISDQLRFVRVASPLRPYATESEYQQLQHHSLSSKGYGLHRDDSWDNVPMQGGYGENLFAEVGRFALVSAEIAKTSSYDIIHAHDWMTYPAAIEAKRHCKAPLVMHVHATEIDRSGDFINEHIYEIERFGLMAADIIIAVSQRTKKTLVSRYGIPEEKIQVVYNGIANQNNTGTKSAQNSLPGKVVTFLGRVTMQKGPDYFLEAAYLVAKKIPDVRFVMAGSGDLLPKMIERMADLNLIDRFHFTGFVDTNKRKKLFDMTDVFVMTSVSEPFGLTPVEAMTHGVPVVVTRQSGVSEVLTHALKVDFWDVRKIADAIISILNEPALSKQLSEYGRADLKNMTWEDAAMKTTNIYSHLLNRHSNSQTTSL